jgi:Peroxiredoxin
MNKSTLLLFILILGIPTFTLMGQDIKSLVIKGKALNSTEKTIELTVTGFLESENIVIPISQNGNFHEEIAIDGIQNLYFYIDNHDVTLLGKSGDTINIFWDSNNFEKTIVVSSSDSDCNKALKAMLNLYLNFNQSRNVLMEKLSIDTFAYIKYKWINDQYNNELKSIIKDYQTSAISKKIEYDIYFNYVNLLFYNKLLPKYLLKSNFTGSEAGLGLKSKSFPDSLDYKRINSERFETCPNYREFIFNYIYGTELFDSFLGLINSGDAVPYSNIRNKCYNAMANIRLYSIRDCIIAKLLINGAGSYCLDDIEPIKNEFLNELKTKKYIDALKAYFDKAELLKHGNPAPDFTFKDQNDKDVSLADFKGKVVFLDFWGIGCSPCIYDIKKVFPLLHQKYKAKEVVFISICLEPNKDSWQKALSNFKMEGINLIAYNGMADPICKAYNVKFIPHYVLIDKDGKIIDNNCSRPSFFLVGKNKLDDALVH